MLNNWHEIVRRLLEMDDFEAKTLEKAAILSAIV